MDTHRLYKSVLNPIPIFKDLTDSTAQSLSLGKVWCRYIDLATAERFREAGWQRP
jgi:hypothetical protein